VRVADLDIGVSKSDNLRDQSGHHFGVRRQNSQSRVSKGRLSRFGDNFAEIRCCASPQTNAPLDPAGACKTLGYALSRGLSREEVFIMQSAPKR